MLQRSVFRKIQQILYLLDWLFDVYWLAACLLNLLIKGFLSSVFPRYFWNFYFSNLANAYNYAPELLLLFMHFSLRICCHLIKINFCKKKINFWHQKCIRFLQLLLTVMLNIFSSELPPLLVWNIENFLSNKLQFKTCYGSLKEIRRSIATSPFNRDTPAFGVFKWSGT